MEWMILPLKRYVDFTGRSRRLEFWMFQLLNLLVYAVMMAMFFSGFPWAELMSESQTGATDPLEGAEALAMFGPLFWIGAGLLFVWWLGTFLPALAVTVRRLHDRGISGWWYAGLLIASFIPLVNIAAMLGYLVLFVFLLLPGEDGPNKWGDNPKDPGQAGVFA
jgi:uncharacterized membrane protein YhaH (DUF805 family)